MSFLGTSDRFAARCDAGFALAVLGPALLTALGFALSSGFDAADIAWLANLFLLALFGAAVIIAGTALIVLTPALFGALPGGACGAIWWWAYRRHVQDRQDRDRRA